MELTRNIVYLRNGNWINLKKHNRFYDIIYARSTNSMWFSYNLFENLYENPTYRVICKWSRIQCECSARIDTNFFTHTENIYIFKPCLLFYTRYGVDSWQVVFSRDERRAVNRHRLLASESHYTCVLRNCYLYGKQI